jgi:hypothetical protein
VIALAATIVDTSALLKVVVASLVTVVGVTIAFSFSILGATRFVDMRHDERRLEAVAFAVLTVLGVSVSLSAVVFGIVVMLSK